MKFFRKRKWTRNRLKCLRLHHLHPFFEKFLGEVPGHTPVAKGYSLTHKQRHIAPMLVFNPPPVVDLVIGSVTDNAMYNFNAILLKIQLSLSEFKMLYLHSRLHHFASFFQNFLGRDPPTPTNGRGHPSRTLPTRPFEPREPPPPPGCVLDPPLPWVTLRRRIPPQCVNSAQYDFTSGSRKPWT